MSERERKLADDAIKALEEMPGFDFARMNQGLRERIAPAPATLTLSSSEGPMITYTNANSSPTGTSYNAAAMVRTAVALDH